MNSTILQIILAVAMLITTTISGFIPLKVIRVLDREDGKSRGKLIISLLSCFSGGVFMATCFLDIFPHINHVYEQYKKDSGLKISFPLPQLFICFGFFVVYLMEEICLKIFGGEGHAHGHHAEDEDMIKNKRELVMESSTAYAMSEPENGSFLKSLTFAIAISFHSLLEGFALGVQDSTTGIVTLFLSLLIHKAIEAFSVGLQICKGNQDKLRAIIITIVIYSLMTPIGSIGGLLLQISSMNPLTKDGIILVLESMAGGTFIYVTFLEVLAPEKENEHNSFLQLFSIFAGFTLITILQIIFTNAEGEHTESLSPIFNATTAFGV